MSEAIEKSLSQKELFEKKTAWFFGPKIIQQLVLYWGSETIARQFLNQVIWWARLEWRFLDVLDVSLWSAMVELSSVQLMPDNRRAFLVCFKNGHESKRAGRDLYDVSVMISYQGLCDILLKTGVYRICRAMIVHERDDFVWDMGEVRRHQIDFGKDRGKKIGAWAMVQLATGERQWEFMTVKEIYDIRARSKEWANAQNKEETIWHQHEDEMMKKSVFRRMTKWLQTTPELSRAIEILDRDTLPFEVPTVEAESRPTLKTLTQSVEVVPTFVPQQKANDTILAGKAKQQDEVNLKHVELVEFDLSSFERFTELAILEACKVNTKVAAQGLVKRIRKALHSPECNFSDEQKAEVFDRVQQIVEKK